MRLTSTKQLVNSPWLQVSRDSYLLPDGREVPEYYIVRRNDTAVCVCRVGDELVLVRQYRPGIQKITLCHPGGRIEPDDQSPVHGALRELLEETGLAPEEVQHIGTFAQIPAVETSRAHMFLVNCIRTRARPADVDPTEYLATVLLPISELQDVIATGEMDCLACAAASYKVLLMKHDLI
ncbi:MAG: NUDIX hydrolase [Micromonosporaceae bacterium]